MKACCCRYTLALLTLICVYLSSSSYAVALQATDTNQDEPTIIFYKLSVIDSQTAYDVVGTFLQGSTSARIQQDKRNNALVVMAKQSEHAILKKLLEKLDNRPAIKQESPKVFRLSEINSGDAIQVVSSILKDKKFSLADDPASNSIIVSADTDTLQMIKDLLALLDKPSGKPSDDVLNCRIRVTWLVDAKSIRFPNLPEGVASEPSVRLADIAKYLAKSQNWNALKTLTSASTLVATLQDDSSAYTVSSSIVQGTQVLESSGTIKRYDDSNDRFLIDFKTTLLSNGDKNQTETSLILKAGHPVAFSIVDFDGLRTVVVLELEVSE